MDMYQIIEEEKLSWFLWLPSIWMVLSISRLGPQWNLVETSLLTEADFLEGSPLLRNILSVLMVLGLYGLSKRDINWPKVLKENIWIIILFAYMGTSTIWSDYTLVAFKRWSKSVGALIMIFVVLSEGNPLAAVSAVLRRSLGFMLITSAVLIQLIPLYGIAILANGYPSWVGITSNKNNLGQIALIGTIYFLWCIARQGIIKGKTNLFLLFISIYLLIGSKSMTSIFILVLAIFLFILFEIRNVNRRYVAAILLFSICLFGLSFATVDQVIFNGDLVPSVVNSFGRDMSFTGRTDLWKDVLAIAAKRPILGYGYGSFWIGDLGNDLWDTYYWHPNQAHNGFIDVYVNLGIVGLTLLILAICSIFRNISQEFVSNYQFAKIRMILFLTILAYNFTESSLCRLTHFLWCVFLLIAIPPLCFGNQRTA